MTKLSVFASYLNSYLKLHGDKEVLSVATACGCDTHDFTIHMADVHDGPPGTNRYTGRDTLDIPKNATLDDEDIDEGIAEDEAFNTGYDEGFADGYAVGVQNRIKENDAGDESARKLMGCLWAVVFACSLVNLAMKWRKNKKG